LPKIGTTITLVIKVICKTALEIANIQMLTWSVVRGINGGLACITTIVAGTTVTTAVAATKSSSPLDTV
jgi:hypothetical protein